MDTSNPISTEELFSAKDLVVVISGGGSGIGLAFANALANSSASKVFLLGRRLAALENAASSINPKIVKAVQCDVTDPESIAAAVKTIEQETDYIDVLINNAGITGPLHTDLNKAESIEELQTIMKRDWKLWNPTWETNTSAIIAMSGAFLHLLDSGNKRRGWVTGKRTHQKKVSGDPKDERSSQIITVASISAFNREVTAGLAYTASKAGAVMLGKSMATFLAPWGIRSNILAPGRFPSEMTEGGATVFPVNQIPHGKQGVYEDMAGYVLYLVSKAGAYLNGNVQVLDGGRLSVMPGTY